MFVSTCVCRKQTNDEIDRDVELPYYELERLYSSTPAGRAMLSDLRKNQTGVAHPDPKAHGTHDNSVHHKNYTCMWPVQRQRELQIVQDLQGAGL